VAHHAVCWRVESPIAGGHRDHDLPVFHVLPTASADHFARRRGLPRIRA
jgi:hypothetical protein